MLHPFGRMGLTNVAAMGGGSAGYSFTNTEAETYVNSLSSDPGDAWKEVFDDLVSALKSASIYSKYDAIWLLQNVTQEAALTNLINPGTYDATAVNSPTFTTKVGMSTNGTTSHIDLTFIPSSAPSPKYTLDSATWGFWDLISGQDANSIGAYGTVSEVSTIRPRNSSDQGTIRINSGNSASVSGSVTDGSGMFLGSRRSSSALEMYRNGVTVVEATGSSAALPDGSFKLGSGFAGALYAGSWALARVGSGFTGAQALAEYNAFNAYRTAVAAL